jgi:predicted NAD/FAD-binding protein
MRIAIVGTGISGLTSAYLLSRKHDVSVFEANDYVGGHTHTVQAKVPSGNYAIDTGFIVFNDWTYPNFIKLMTEVGVNWQDSTMSFSVKTEQTGIEYNGTNLNTLFAQRFNFLRPSFHRMIQDILRFNKESLAVLGTNSTQTLAEYLIEHRYSAEFKNNYIVPMGAAIWSSSVDQMDHFPIEYFVRFFKNHGMLSVSDRPVWKVIVGGSSAYIPKLSARFQDRIFLNTPVMKVTRAKKLVQLTVKSAGKLEEREFDQVVFACHSNQTMAMIQDLTADERSVLSSFQYQGNDTVLHTDINVLPKKKLAWAAWNYLVPREKKSKVAVTYIMNILQGIRAPETFCVSLNMTDQIDASKILQRFQYDHPVYSAEAFAAQKRWGEVSGKNQTHFCGAYWGYGFHEDGVKSALKVCEAFGEVLGEASHEKVSVLS